MFDKFRNLTSYYRNINPSTLSGTCDIIAVNHGDVIRSTPFRARFGKKQVFCLFNHSVTMYVNDKRVNMNLRLGNQGEVLFGKDDEGRPALSRCITPKNESKESNECSRIDIEKDNNIKLFRKHIERLESPSFLKAREDYRNLRLRFLNESIYTQLTRKYKTFQLLLDSVEHRNFLVTSHSRLRHILIALMQQDPLPTLTFSACLRVKIINNHVDTFERHKMHMLENPDILVVHLKCSCSEFYMPYPLFSHLFFLLRSLMSSNNAGTSSHFHATLSKLLDIPHIMQTTLTPTAAQLKRMNLNYGRNTIMFRVDGTSKTITTYLFLLRPDTRIVISDIDGTITRSDAWGHVYNMIGKDWTHSGVAELFDKISKNEYLFLYLSSRPLGQIRNTRKYLAGVEQNGYRLPIGPILHSPDGLFGAIYREIILRKPEEFKIACLKEVMDIFPMKRSSNFQVFTSEQLKTVDSCIFTRDSSELPSKKCSSIGESIYIDQTNIKTVFADSEIIIQKVNEIAIEASFTPFVAGFGNRKTDIITYKAVGIHRSKIFTIDSTGRIVPEFTNTVSGSYLSLNNIVEKVFPPRKMTAAKRTTNKWWEYNKP